MAEQRKEKGNMAQLVVSGYADYMGRAVHDTKESIRNDFEKTLVAYGQGEARDRDSLRADREASKSRKREGIIEHHTQAQQLHEQANAHDKTRSQAYAYEKARSGHKR